MSLSHLSNTRGYLEKVAKEAVICFDHCQYDASLLMIRKLIEILIIELYERHNLANKIKELADLSAHNRRFIAKITDIEKIQFGIRVVIEELVHLIDYPNWK